MWNRLVGMTASDWQAIGSMGTLVVAVVAALYARSQVKVAQAVRADQAQPQVVIDFSVRNTLVEIVVTNMGTTTARNVKLAFDPPLESTLADTDPDFFSAKLLSEGAPSMPPGKEYRFLFESGPARYNRHDLPRSYTATASFTDAHGKNNYSSTYILDFETYFNLRHLSVHGLDDAAKALQEIQKTLHGWSEGNRGLRVVSRDGDARDEAERAYIEQLRAEQQLRAAGVAESVACDDHKTDS